MMVILDKLEVNLPANWIEYDNPADRDLPTFVNRNNPNSGALQISYAEYTGGKIPNPSKKQLETMALNVCLNDNPGGRTTEQKSGRCKFGIFGTATVISASNLVFKAWYLSDSKNFVMASYINVAERNPAEIKEAGKIVREIAGVL